LHFPLDAVADACALRWQGVHATILLNREGEAVRSNAEARRSQRALGLAPFAHASAPPAPQPAVTSVYAELIPQLASLARSLVRDLDPQARPATHGALRSALRHAPPERRSPRRTTCSSCASAARSTRSWSTPVRFETASAAHCTANPALTLFPRLRCADPEFTLIVIQDPSVGTASDPHGGESDSAAQRHAQH
jgi:hypothetical protein